MIILIISFHLISNSHSFSVAVSNLNRIVISGWYGCCRLVNSVLLRLAVTVLEPWKPERIINFRKSFQFWVDRDDVHRVRTTVSLRAVPDKPTNKNGNKRIRNEHWVNECDDDDDDNYGPNLVFDANVRDTREAHVSAVHAAFRYRGQDLFQDFKVSIYMFRKVS